MIDDKESDERDQISKIDEENIIEDIEIMKLQHLSSKKNIYILRENMTKYIQRILVTTWTLKKENR